VRLPTTHLEGARACSDSMASYRDGGPDMRASFQTYAHQHASAARHTGISMHHSSHTHISMHQHPDMRASFQHPCDVDLVSFTRAHIHTQTLIDALVHARAPSRSRAYAGQRVRLRTQTLIVALIVALVSYAQTHRRARAHPRALAHTQVSMYACAHKP
jgi:hypothetical protein